MAALDIPWDSTVDRRSKEGFERDWLSWCEQHEKLGLADRKIGESKCYMYRLVNDALRRLRDEVVSTTEGEWHRLVIIVGILDVKGQLLLTYVSERRLARWGHIF